MKSLPLTVLAFGLLWSSAFAQEGLEKSSGPVSSLLEQTGGLRFSPVSTLIAPPAAMLISVSPNNRNTAASRLQLQPISPAFQKKTFASSAMSTRLREFKSIISRRRNTSATIHYTYSFSFPADLPGRFTTTSACVEQVNI